MTITRRRFLASTLGAAALTGPFAALGARRAAAARLAASPDYGPLAPVADHTTGLPLLSLPSDAAGGYDDHERHVRTISRRRLASSGANPEHHRGGFASRPAWELTERPPTLHCWAELKEKRQKRPVSRV